jgi:hypothetical protein
MLFFFVHLFLSFFPPLLIVLAPSSNSLVLHYQFFYALPLLITFVVYLFITLCYRKGYRSARKLGSEYRILRRAFRITALESMRTLIFVFICTFGVTFYSDGLSVRIKFYRASTADMLTVKSDLGFRF